MRSRVTMGAEVLDQERRNIFGNTRPGKLFVSRSPQDTTDCFAG